MVSVLIFSMVRTKEKPSRAFFSNQNSTFLLVASIADLADLLKSETQDDFIVGLQDTLSDVFSSPTIFSLAHVKHPKMNLFTLI